MGVVDKFKEFVAPIDDEGDDILEVEEEVEETPRSRYERPKTKNVNTSIRSISCGLIPAMAFPIRLM